MITKTLAPILHRDAYTRAVEPIVASYFRDVLYGPLLEILSEFHVPGVRRTNATEGSALAAALKRGDVWYADGVFSGTFSPYVARELRELGAEFVQKGIGPGAIPIRGFRISIDRLPPEVRSASVESLNRAREVHKQVGAYLDAAATNYAAAPTGIDVDLAMVKIVDDLNSQFSASVEGIEAIKAISVKAQITPAIREQLTKQLTENLNLDVKNFLAHEIPELRKLAEENAFAGGRADKLARIIQARYGVGRRKAAFLAEQETSLVVSKYREGQARGIGSQFYVWSTSHDERVRHDHKRLNNTRQSWDVKPVTNLKTGARNAPGEDFRCLPSNSRVEFTGRIEKGFRRRYSGELTTLVLESGKTIRATPNHPVLTTRGWKAIGLLDKCDHVVELSDEAMRVASMKREGQQGVTSIGQIFETLREASLCEAFMGEREQFHGDGSHSNVDVVWTAWGLFIDRKRMIAERLRKDVLVQSALFAATEGGLFQSRFTLKGCHPSGSDMAGSGQGLAAGERQFGHAQTQGFGASPNGDASFDETSPNDDSFKPCSLRNGQFTFSPKVSFDQRFWVNIKTVSCVRASLVRSVRSESFHGHVFNLQTEGGYYTTDGVIVSNCRCVAMPMLSFQSPADLDVRRNSRFCVATRARQT